jgi:hypothetical protein
MTPELRIALGLALVAGVLTGLILALLEEEPEPFRVVVIADPAAYELASMFDEARRIVAEAADSDS